MKWWLVKLKTELALSQYIRRTLTAITTRLSPPLVIMDREGGSPYLSRYYLLSDRSQTGSARPFNVFLHRFHRSDDDGALHSHPWRWSLALVLVGGYIEERRVGDRVIRRRVGPCSLNLLREDTFHRVDLLENDSWSLFIAGPHARSGTWYFWDRHRKERATWTAFIAEKRGGPEADWARDRREHA